MRRREGKSRFACSVVTKRAKIIHFEKWWVSSKIAHASSWQVEGFVVEGTSWEEFRVKDGGGGVDSGRSSNHRAGSCHVAFAVWRE